MSLWERYKEINEELKKDFLCIPPYQSVTGKFVGELFAVLRENNHDQLHGKIVGAINNPYQRAYQMEYRYKHCDIFESFMPVIEYAHYDAMSGNFVCAYLSLLPAVEAIIRKWYEVTPGIVFESMRKTIDVYKDPQIFHDDRVAITDAYVDYLEFIFRDVLYIRCKAYEDSGFKDTFNRNLALHSLDGAVDFFETMRNLTRLFLVLDVIAELYMMKNPTNYWNWTFYTDPENNTDFNIRWELYKKLMRESIGPTDLIGVYNCFISKKVSEEDKKVYLNDLKYEEKLFEKLHLKKVIINRS